MFHRIFSAMFILPLLTFPAAADPGSPQAVGGEFQVNTTTASYQSYPAVAADADGDFVVAWESGASGGSDSSSASIQGQRFDSAGGTVGGEFQVNTTTTTSQRRPAVATGAGGDFVVVWQSARSSGSDVSYNSIQGQRFDSAGAPVGDEFQVNTYTTHNQIFPAVAAGAAGDFVVVWTSNGSSGSDTSSYSIRGRRFDSAGVPVGDEFQANTYTPDNQRRPAVAAGAGGDFVVVWQSSGSGGSDVSNYSVQGRRFDSAGAPIGGEFQINTYTTSNQRNPAVAADGDNGFVVVWQSLGSSGSDGDKNSIQGQRFDAAGTPIGGEFQVNTYTTANQRFPAAATDGDGSFVVVWSSIGSSGSDASGQSVQGRRFDSAGAAVGDELQVNTYTMDDQLRPAVAAEADGDFVVVWESLGSSGSDASDTSVQGQRFDVVDPNATCIPSPTNLCLNRDRFRVEVDWRDFVGNTGTARVVPFGSDDSGLLWFFAAENWEMLIKVLDGCGFNDHFWVFSAATTNVEYTLRVTDTIAEVTETYVNPLGTAAAAITDTFAFDTCDAGSGSTGERDRGQGLAVLEELRQLPQPLAAAPAGFEADCTPGDASLCLNGGRFKVEVEWRDFVGNTGTGRVVPFGSDDSGLLWFFAENNWEMLIKVLDGCGFNDHFWVFSAATTNVEYRLRVTDTETLHVREYLNPLGTAADAITDTMAFDTCL